jgi:hypothetical protein
MDWAEKTGTIDWSTMRSGWGLDTVYCALVVYLGKKIYRDSSVRFFHYEGTSYDWGPAGQEMVVVMDAFKVFCASRDMDPERIQRVYDIAYDKARTHRALSVSDVYLNHAPSLVI